MGDAPKHYNIRVEIEEVTEAHVEKDRYGNLTSSSERKVLELVNFKTQRSTIASATRAATGAIELATEEGGS